MMLDRRECHRAKPDSVYIGLGGQFSRYVADHDGPTGSPDQSRAISSIVSMSAKSAELSDQIYQLKITLRASKPPIWRRVMVPGHFSLYKLHQVIQMAMGWTNSHLHQFIIDDQYYSIPSPDDWEPIIDERRYTLSQMAPYAKRKFVYEYDFGDSWEHTIVVEKILPPESGAKYPMCIKGKRACPPEDVGGMWGYATFLEAIKDPTHEEHDSYVEWSGGEFDSEEFNLDDINQGLRRVK